MSLLCDWPSSTSSSIFSATPCLALSGTILLTDKHNPLMIQAILNWGMAMESWVTTPAMGASIMWLQNMGSLVTQLCSTVAYGDTLAIVMC
jgi:hypothetical protein